jgi:hypothetical protein
VTDEEFEKRVAEAEILIDALAEAERIDPIGSYLYFRNEDILQIDVGLHEQ